MSTDPPQDDAAERHHEQQDSDKIGVLAKNRDQLMAAISAEKPWSERVRRAELVSKGYEKVQAEEVPDADEPGKHAIILDPTVVELRDNYLAYEVILPDGFSGMMIVKENPHPGPIISSVYEYFALDPQQATPSDLYMKHVPVREVIDDNAIDKRWVLDLPDRSGRLHRARRDLQDRGVVTWDSETIPYHRNGSGHHVKVPRKLYGDHGYQNIAMTPQTKPRVSPLWKWLAIGFCTTLSVASLALGMSLTAAAVPILLLLAVGLVIYIGLTISRKSTKQLAVPAATAPGHHNHRR